MSSREGGAAPSAGAAGSGLDEVPVGSEEEIPF
jgi:hypothetical protein